MAIHDDYDDTDDDLLVKGDRLLVTSPASLPHYCVDCGAEVDEMGERRDKTLNWIPPWTYIFILIGILIFVLVALVTQKKVKIEYSLCAEHSARFKTRRLVNGSVWILCILLIVGAIALQNAAMAVLIPIVAIAGIVTLIRAGERLKVVHVKNGEATLKGASPQFLAQIDND